MCCSVAGTFSPLFISLRCSTPQCPSERLRVFCHLILQFFRYASHRDAARRSVGSVMPVKSLKLRHTIRLLRELDAEIEDIEVAIQSMMDEMQSPITTIPGIGVRMGAMILAEIGDFSRFAPPDKILAYRLFPRFLRYCI
jgi:transposase